MVRDMFKSMQGRHPVLQEAKGFSG
jgi:hypothetical protein